MKSFKAEETDRLNTTLHKVEHSVQRFKHDIQEHSAELALDEKAVAYQQEHPDVSYSDALAVAMTENPALSAEFVASMGHVSAAQVRQFGIEPDYDNEDAGSIAAGKELDRLAQAWLREHPTEKDYKVALDIALAAHPDLGMLWSKSFNSAKKQTFKESGEGDSGKELDRLASKLQTEHPDWSYEKCLGQILDQHVELRKKYAANK